MIYLCGARRLTGGGRVDRFVAVGAFQKDDAQRSAALFVLEVEQQILVETEETRLPFTAVQRTTL